jgi:hypothetical protein
LEKSAFRREENLCSGVQNGLAFKGRTGKSSVSRDLWSSKEKLKQFCPRLELNVIKILGALLSQSHGISRLNEHLKEHLVMICSI